MSWSVAVISLSAVLALTSSHYTCSDCNTASIISNQHLVASVRCPTSSSFCHWQTGTCSSTPDHSMCSNDGVEKARVKRSTLNDIFCLDDGLYPADDCREYYSCSNYTIETNRCEDDEVFHAELGSCRKGSICGRYNCTSSGRKMPHSAFPSFYTYCLDAQPLALGRCEGEFEMDYATQTCIQV